MSRGARHHMILVPGFGGFDALGSVAYYSKVQRVLRETKELSVHFFPNLPMASVAARAEALSVWIGKRVDRGVIDGEADVLHLLGHSTGGLDLRELLGGRLRSDILAQVRSVQFLSTPHRGTNLARWLGGLGPVFRCGALGLVRGLSCLGSRATGCLGHALRRRQAPARDEDWLDALREALSDMSQCGESEYGAATAREAYHDTLQWLDNMARDTAAIDDLHPESRAGQGPDWPDLRVRSMATRAEPIASDRTGLFAVLHRLIARDPPPSLYPGADRVLLPVLGGGQSEVGLADNDGIVNTLSMVWPDVASTQLVEADHGDIVGHYPGQGPEGYDLLRSAAPFARARFEEVWRSVRRFALEA